MAGELSGLEAAVVVLAVYRLTLLVVADELTAPWRDRAVRALNERKHGGRPAAGDGLYDGPEGPAALQLDVEQWRRDVALSPHRLAFLLSCPWCASPYVAAVVVSWVAYGDPGRLSWSILAVLAVSGAVGFLATKASP